MKNQRNDTKLLLTVTGCVVAGAACIMLIAGLAVDREAEKEETRSTPAFDTAPVAAKETVIPAVATPENPTAIAASYETASPEPLRAEEDPVDFVIDPSEDLVAGGLQAYGVRDFDRAAAYFVAEAEARPQRAWTHYMLGLSLWKAGRIDEGEMAMEEAGHLDPDSTRTLVNLARIRNDQGDFEGALEAARAAQAIDEEDPSALFLTGRSLFNLGRLDEALASLTASIEIAPDDGYAQNMLGLTLIRQGRAEEAVPPLVLASELVPQVAYVHNNLGMALELSGRRSEAVAAYRRAAEIDPVHGKSAANLARLEPVPGVEAESTQPVVTQSDEEAEAAVQVAAAAGDSTP
jgi:tetratricopeptide (TPR) repeat protein